MYKKREINEKKRRFNFRFSKSLGQNFLTDGNIIKNILDASLIGEEDLVIEIGPGMGAITEELVAGAKKVVAVELDSNLIPILQEIFAEASNLKLIHSDILKLDLARIIEEGKKELQKGEEFKAVRVVGNLPYYITTPIIMHILERSLEIDSITVMMQKEVAERIEAPPGGKNRGAISVAVQYYGNVEKICIVPKEVFYPVPKVDSAVLRIDLKKNLPMNDEERKIMFSVIKAGFGQRRKTLMNSLSGGLGLPKTIIEAVLKEVGIDKRRRAETLTIREFGNIAMKLKEMK